MVQFACCSQLRRRLPGSRVARAADRLRGSGFGLLGGLQSVGDFLSSATVGLLYAAVSPAAGFAYAAAWMGLAVAAVAWLSRR
jgi:hypothetical protein